MKLETLEQRAYRERDLQTKRLVLGMARRQIEQASKAVARLEREIAALEGIETCICTFADRRICPQHGKGEA
jgi:hypothetical protein